jgi:hypothetical protein
MLYQHTRPSFWRRHPLITGAAAIIVCWQLMSASYVVVAVEVAVVLAIVVDRRQRALAKRNAGLAARADYEHRLRLAGDPRGIYGRYPPIQPGWFADPRNPWLLRYFDGAFWTGHTAFR